MKKWIPVGEVSRFPKSGGACVLVEQEQIAIFNFDWSEWYAVQNLCPHENQMVLSRGLIGDSCGEPKVACPLHKNSFSLKDGRHMGGQEDMKLKTYGVEVRDGQVHLSLEG